MKINLQYIFLLSLIISLSACNKSEYTGKPVGKVVDIDNLLKERAEKPLAEVYAEHGNYINSKESPSIINPSKVIDHLDDYLLIDIRDADAYAAGHINGAYNVARENIIDFLTETQNTANYDKIVIICYSGQLASYVTGILRYAGFPKTFALRNGMAGWNADFAGILKNNYAKKYPQLVERKVYKESNDKQHETSEAEANTAELPALDSLPISVLVMDHARKLLQQPRKDFLVKASEVMPELSKNADKYFIMMYLNEKTYNDGHIIGTHLFHSRKDLSFDTNLTSLPKDKPILVYCKTGHTGGHATAYLQMLGYDAYNLMFGKYAFDFNIFSHNIEDFSEDFPYITGSDRTSYKAVAGSAPSAAKAKSTAAKPVVRRKKKAVSGGCG